MQIQQLKQEKNELFFLIKDINPVIANTLRRLMLIEVPTLAIEEVNFLKNDSALYDEIIAHRLGLIPLTTDLKSYELKEECTCKGKGCPKCELQLTLKAKGPCTVYSSELKSSDPKTKPVYENIPITLLTKGQKLELEATAVLGKGKKHAKFSPGWIYYFGNPEFEIKSDSGLKKIEESCKDAVKIEGKQIKITDISKWKESYEEIFEKNNVKVNRSEKDFIFYIESFGQLSPKQMIEESLKIFDEKLDDFVKSLKETKEGKIKKIGKKIKKK